MCTQWRRTIAGGTILFWVFKEIIKSLKKSMCKILLIKTEQNSHRRSSDFTNKVGSRAGRCHSCGQKPRVLPARLRNAIAALGPTGSSSDDRSVCDGGRTATQILTAPGETAARTESAAGTAAGGGDLVGRAGKGLGRTSALWLPVTTAPLLGGRQGHKPTLREGWGSFLCATEPTGTGAAPNTHHTQSKAMDAREPHLPSPAQHIPSAAELLFLLSSTFSLCTQGFYPGLASSIGKESS